MHSLTRFEISVDHSLKLIISILDHQPQLVLTTLILVVASAGQALYLACLRVWGWPSGLDHNSRIRVSSILVLVVQVTRRVCRRVFFSYKSLNGRKGKIQVPTSYLQDSPLRFFLSYESLKSRKRRIFFPTSYMQGHVRGSRWVLPGLVCRQK